MVRAERKDTMNKYTFEHRDGVLLDVYASSEASAWIELSKLSDDPMDLWRLL